MPTKLPGTPMPPRKPRRDLADLDPRTKALFDSERAAFLDAASKQAFPDLALSAMDAKQVRQASEALGKAAEAHARRTVLGEEND